MNLKEFTVLGRKPTNGELFGFAANKKSRGELRQNGIYEEDIDISTDVGDN